MTGFETYRQMALSATQGLRRSVKLIPEQAFGLRPVPGAPPASFIYFHVLRCWDRDINMHCSDQEPVIDAWHRGGFSKLTGHELLPSGRATTIRGRFRHMTADTYLHVGDIDYVEGLIGAPATDAPCIA